MHTAETKVNSSPADLPLDGGVRLSIIVPVYNERQNIQPLAAAVASHLAETTYELIFVDDGSTDGSGDAVQALMAGDSRVKLLQLAKNYGQTQALSQGVQYSSGEIIVFLDGDLQNDPADIPSLLQRIEAGADVVSGWRRNRQDRLIDRKVPSLLANRMISRVFKTELHDIGCTLKAYRRQVLEEIEFTNDLHRILPLYAHERGYVIEEVEVTHAPRRHGSSKYGLGRVLSLSIDLFFFYFFSRFLRRPMQFFGKSALLLLLLGFLAAILVIVRRVFWGGDWISPAFFFSFIAILMSFQLLLFGIVCELVTRIYFHREHRPSCRVKRAHGFPRRAP